MPAEITIYLSTDHIRAEESNRGIKELVQKNYASSDYSSLLTPYFIATHLEQLRKTKWFAVLQRVADVPSWF